MTALDAFWTARPVFEQIHQYAQARRVSPWAMFGGVLARVIAATEPHVQLPPIVGGPGSLNLFVAIVGRSGQGKGASQAAAASFLDINQGALFDTITVGSGEGLAAAYVGRVKDDDGNMVVQQHSESAMFDIAEVDTLTALAGRQGSTLMSELRKVWSGERLGFQNRDMTRTLPVDAHSYRASLIAGVQPERAAALLDDEAGGTPQRFIWLPATDETAPQRAPHTPGPWSWTAPNEYVIPTQGSTRPMGVCEEAWAIIDSAQVARLKGEGNALDGHALFTRLKVAAALALMDGRGEVSITDWQLAGDVMKVSNRTRRECKDTIRQKSMDVNRARAEARAEANVVTADHTEQVQLNTAKERIIGKLGTEWVSSSTVRAGISQSLREKFEQAVEDLAATGAVEIARDTYQGRDRVRLRLSHDESSGLPGLIVSPEKPRNSGVLSPDPGSHVSHGRSSVLTTKQSGLDAVMGGVR